MFSLSPPFWQIYKKDLNFCYDECKNNFIVLSFLTDALSAYLFIIANNIVVVGNVWQKCVLVFYVVHFAAIVLYTIADD